MDLKKELKAKMYKSIPWAINYKKMTDKIVKLEEEQ